MDGLVEELIEGARAEMAIVAEHGGAVEAVSYMKTQLVESHRERVAAIERGDHKVVGQNVYTSTEASPLAGGEDGGIMTVDPGVEASAIEAVRAWRSERVARTPTLTPSTFAPNQNRTQSSLRPRSRCSSGSPRQQSCSSAKCRL